MTGHRIGLDVLRRHGFDGGDNLHAGQAIFLIGVLVRIYDGSRDHPNGPSTSQPPDPPARGPSVPEDDLDAVTLTYAGVRAVRTALDLAAHWKRGRAEMHLMRRPVLLQIPAPPPRCPHHHQLAVQLRYHEQAARPHVARPSQTPPASQPIRRSASDY
jgi:hypothetical protein